jgi:hypothetical protein
LALLAGGGLVLIQFLTPGRGITRENYERLREGMTQKQVEAILGVPPGVYTSDSTHYYPFSGPGPFPMTLGYLVDRDLHRPFEGRKAWYGDRFFVWVESGPDRRATFIQGVRAEQDNFLLHWLRRLR